MGFWSKVKDIYKRVDQKLGGYLPGGVAPSSTSTSTSTSTPSPTSSSGTSGTSSSGSTTTTTRSGGGGGSTTITTQPAQNLGGVVVTDYTTGESVTTKVSSGGKITSQTYSSVGSSGGLIGQERAIEYANQPGGLVYYQTTAPAPQQTGKVISAKEYTRTPIERYQQPISSALRQSMTNALNVGVIGSAGFGSYFKGVFFEPFEYVGTPSAYKDIYPKASWRGTELGYGMSKEQMEVYTPSDYKGTEKTTLYEIGEQQKKALFGRAGVEYKGEPARILPYLIQEQVAKDLSPQFQAEIEAKNKELFGYYQGEVNAGKLGVTEAQSQYESAAALYAANVNKRYQTQISQVSSQRYSAVASQIPKIESMQRKIFEPPAYPIIRGTGKAIETGAIIGGTLYGGSGITIAIAGYEGIKTGGAAFDYAGSYKNLSTRQKVTGGAGLLLGVAATAYTFNLGVKRFYGEWRNIIYTDLAKTPAKVEGYEVIKTDEFTRYHVASIRQRGINQAQTYQNVDVYATGENRIGFYSKGYTYTKVFDPQTESIIATRSAFRTSGNIPNIQYGNLAVGTTKAKVIYEDVYSGLGNAIYQDEKTFRTFRFISGSKDQGVSYSVIGGKAPAPAFDYTTKEGLRVTTSIYRGNLESYGRIWKISDMTPTGEGQTSTNFIVGSGRKSSQAYFNNLYTIGGSAGAELGTQVQGYKLAELSTQTIKGQPLSSVGFTASQVQSSPTLVKENRFSQSTRQLSYQLPSLRQPNLVAGKQEAVGGYVAPSSPASLVNAQINKQSSISVQLPAQINAPATATVQRPAIRSGIINPIPPAFAPGVAVPPTTNGLPFLPRFNLNPGGLDLSSRILKGGSRVTSYTPSFTALVFNLRGKAPAPTYETGINFRPITKGFSFSTGLNIPKIRRRRILF